MVSLNTTLGLALWVCGLCICSELHTQKGLTLGLMLCCCHLEIPNRYSIRGPVFSFCNVADPHNTIFRGMKLKKLKDQIPSPCVSSDFGLMVREESTELIPSSAKPQSNWEPLTVPRRCSVRVWTAEQEIWNGGNNWIDLALEMSLSVTGVEDGMEGIGLEVEGSQELCPVLPARNDGTELRWQRDEFITQQNHNNKRKMLLKMIVSSQALDTDSSNCPLNTYGNRR